MTKPKDRPCTTPDCDRILKPGGAKGLCPRCYGRRRRGRDADTTRPISAPGEGGQVGFRFPLLERARVERAAKKAGISFSEFWQRAGRELADKLDPPKQR